MEINWQAIGQGLGAAIVGGVGALIGKTKLDQAQGHDYATLKAQVEAHAALDSQRWAKIERHMETQGQTFSDIDRRLAHIEGRFKERDERPFR